ncbi:uncharacterized protein LOC128025651 [Carassius gibelio]|uniref:uncharacterized protein LOC128025651 n=1 Tax=Carassius gibelio TaxID=101364 RepID=UPI002278E4EA|nr:uncharacterized protein LOC128025651 [Carassius gibelio]
MSNKKKPTTSTFYSEPAMMEELYTGYLLKSPPLTALTKGIVRLKSWKRRFFVLCKTREDSYHLTYHANNETKEIDLSKISQLFIGPEAHQKWDWIQKHFKCSPSSVLFLKVEDDTPKHSRDYFLIGENSDDVDGWLNAIVKVMKIQRSGNTLQDNRFRSASEPVKSSEPKVDYQPNDRRSAPELMLTYPSPSSHYDYPRKLSEPPVPVTPKIPVIEHKDEKDEMQDESAEDSSEYMCMASFVSDCQMMQNLCLFHKGDQILAFNDLLIDTVEEIQMYLRRLSKNEVKLTIRRLIGSQPLHSEPCSHNEDMKQNHMISLLFIGPEAHQKWDWIQKNFKCFPSSVLFLKVEDDTLKQAREYFLIGENRDEVEGLHTAIDKVMKIQKSQNKLQHTDASNLQKITVIEEKDAKEGKQDEPPRDNNEYMTMGSVQMVLEGGQQEEDTACKKKT